MSISKESLNNFLPDGFETENKEEYKTPFDSDLIQTGYEKDIPDIVTGPNLNNFIDVVGKNTNIANKYINYLNEIPINKTPIVDVNNNLNHTQIGLKVYSVTETFLLNDLVTGIVDEQVKICKSLIPNNLGNELNNPDAWEEINIDTWVYYQNGTSGYRYNRRNGYCEQWGVAPGGGNGSAISLLKNYRDTDYIILTNVSNSGSGTYAVGSVIEGKGNDKFYYHTWNYNSVGVFAPFNWKTVGYLAQEQY